MKSNSGKKNCELKIPRCITLETMPLWQNTRMEHGQSVDNDFREMNKSTPLTKRH